jgi:hypothetical protein
MLWLISTQAGGAGRCNIPHGLMYVLFCNKVPSVPPTVRAIYKVILRQKKGTWDGRLT